MINYQQPDFYRFSEDSILLARLVLEVMAPKRGSTPLKILDLGAGCGVIGLEVAAHVAQASRVTFCEKQLEQLIFLETNCAQLAQKKESFDFKICSSDWNTLEEGGYDLIVSNPPYFLDTEGLPSSDERTNQARRWNQAQERDFYQRCLELLAPHGLIALVLRRAPAPFFLERVEMIREQTFHQRQNILTKGFVFALNVETDK